MWRGEDYCLEKFIEQNTVEMIEETEIHAKDKIKGGQPLSLSLSLSLSQCM